MNLSAATVQAIDQRTVQAEGDPFVLSVCAWLAVRLMRLSFDMNPDVCARELAYRLDPVKQMTVIVSRPGAATIAPVRPRR